ncbi:CYTH and CHAD domain-containing protein [Roseibium denhamense]|uniref:Inorganic triphosphatase YgiF, contains CYTH and CHAD domains n=1 Tax=Roseibium denhamense TaxID=76305 RepID=A0ABY1PAP4_9HYPH|nr:CYTH and CHAD domain-containing protein [Roseibium denhamense]MTI07415.1 CYTH and CHAD domain-containing protein [Roseibium denhamense]SMP29422.1 Inorganic triphosphatase YgiF, contains CYTH and CHAD domains [Roseibium denhamense]
MSKSGREIELKLELDPAAQDAMKRAGAIDGFSASRAVTKTLQSIYFDTPGQDLRQSKISLRVRKSGRSWVQTAKIGTGVLGGLSSPIEAEHPVKGRALDFGVIEDQSVTEILSETIGSAPLSECFETVMKRTTRILTRESDGAEIELAFDTGNILAGDATHPLVELEMELKSGPSQALFDAAKGLLNDVPFRFSPFSKAERGYRASEGRSEAAHKPLFAEPVVFSQGTSVEHALRDVLRSCLTQISENRLAVLASDDPEGPHQLRVGLRRLRSAFRIFKPVLNPATMAPLDAIARQIAAEAGALRDLDVLVDEIVVPVIGKAPDSITFDALLDDLNTRRDQDTRSTLVAHLQSAEVNAFLLDLAAYTEGRGWLDPEDFDQSTHLAQPIEAFASLALAKHWKKVLKFGKRLDELTVPERHDMRKAMKKLRYGIEFFACLYPKDTVKPLLKRMKKLQDIFGYLNDVAMAETLPEKCKVTGKNALPASQAIGFVIGWHEAQCQAMWQHAKGYWDSTRETPKFWV